LIEVWLGLFMFILLRNKFIQYYFESNGIYKYKQYSIKQIFKHWSVYPPLLFVLFYLYLEYTIFIKWYYFLQYQNIIKIVTLLSYLPLVIKYHLYENDNPKYIKNEYLSVATSPMVIAGFFLWLGSELNKLAMYFNNNKMPTYPNISYWTGYINNSGFIDGIHTIGTSHSSLILICNIFDLGYGVLSFGDLLVRLYVFIILYYSIKNKNKYDERRN